jgi:hypothetical protein
MWIGGFFSPFRFFFLVDSRIVTLIIRPVHGSVRFGSNYKN